MTAIKRYLSPRTLEETLRVVAEPDAIVLAGGTDLLPRRTRGLIESPVTLVSLRRLDSLGGVGRENGEVRVGAYTTLSDVAADAIINDAAPVLAHAAGRIACPQVRNRATIGGNLCNASPAADTAVPLILLDATVELTCWSGSEAATRRVPIADFFRGPGATVLTPGEILTAIRFKPLPAGVFAAWDKHGTRPSMEIAVASVGVALEFEAGAVAGARVAYGSVAPIPLRGRAAEAELLDNRLSAEVIERCIAAARAEIAPISDVRAGAAYRREVVGVMLRRMLGHGAGQRQG